VSELMSEFVGGGLAKMGLVSLEVPILEGAETDEQASIANFWYVGTCRNANLDGIVPAFSGVVAGEPPAKVPGRDSYFAGDGGYVVDRFTEGVDRNRDFLDFMLFADEFHRDHKAEESPDVVAGPFELPTGQNSRHLTKRLSD